MTLTNTDEQGVVDVEIRTIKSNRGVRGLTRIFESIIEIRLRLVKLWRALKGPGNEVFFPQIYKPGEWCESDFTRMNPLGVTINGVPFDHMLYHFVLCYCNWETGTVCFSESYESLSAGADICRLTIRSEWAELSAGTGIAGTVVSGY